MRHFFLFAVMLLLALRSTQSKLIGLEFQECVRTHPETANCTLQLDPEGTPTEGTLGSPTDTPTPNTPTPSPTEIVASLQLDCLRRAAAIVAGKAEEHCFAVATEVFEPSISCIASNGTFGGWGMRLRSEVPVVPSLVETLEVSTTVYSTTDPEDLFTAPHLPVTVALVPDLEPQRNLTIIRRCSIEDAKGPQATLQVTKRRPQAGEADVVIALPGEGGGAGGAGEAGAPQIPIFQGDAPVPEGKLLLEVVGHNVTELSNGGPIPPAIMKTVVTMRHRLRLSKLSDESR